MTQTPIRIAGVQGFYGDSPAGAMAVVREGAADYLMHDALAELTLSILQKDRTRDPNLGYARDIEFLAAKMYPKAFAKGMKIVTSSGGLNPLAAGNKVAAILKAQGLSGIKIAVITGDDVLDRLPELRASGQQLEHLTTGAPFEPGPKKVTHANVYVGAACIKEALDKGAQLILAGRVADPCLTLGILAHEFGWKLEGDDLDQGDLDKLASGITVGHVLECGGQASGGNSYAEWPMDYTVSNLGYPIAHVREDGTAIFTKMASQGGKMSRNTVREQLVYEIHDPGRYITPDVVVDLRNISLRETGENLVELSGVKGAPRPQKLKLAIGLTEGFISDQLFFFSWPFAWKKALKFVQAVKQTWAHLPVPIQKMEFSYLGINGIHGPAAPQPEPEQLENMNEIGVRIALRHEDPKAGKIALQSVIGLALNGPPGLISMPGWGKANRALLSLWPALIDRKHINMEVNIIEV